MATIYDVAKAAGVSPKTVSRVLNGDAPVNEKTRAAVNAAMASLNYVRSNAARTMRSRRSGLVGLITGAISATPEALEPAGLPDILIVQGAQRTFAEAGMTLLITDVGRSAERVPEMVQTFLEHQVEGLIYVAEYHQKITLPPVLAGRPVVLANCFDDAGTPAVVPDDRQGEFDLVKGLIERGHRRIGFLTLPVEQVARGLRLEGYRAAHQEAGIDVDEALIEPGALIDIQHEYDRLPAALDRILAQRPAPTAICCGNDKMAMRVYALLRERGIDIPSQISVVGYDDYLMITQQLHPTLTSTRLPYRGLGSRAAERLLQLVAGGKDPGEAPIESVSGPVAWRESVQVLETQSPATTP
ncbi:MAG TPA: LacI family DNA-binding transcriptional regulator [Devosiaceae bacterium]